MRHRRASEEGIRRLWRAALAALVLTSALAAADPAGASLAAGCDPETVARASGIVVTPAILDIAVAGPAAPDPVLRVRGRVDQDALEAGAEVVLGDAVASRVKPVGAVDDSGDRHAGGFTLAFTKADLAGLAEGLLTVELRVCGVRAGAARQVLYDVTAPSFSVSLPAGVYVDAERVALTAEAQDDALSYALDGGAPVAYAGVPIELGPGDHLLVVRSVDRAGNTTSRTLAYTIGPAPLAPAGPAPPVRPSFAFAVSVGQVEPPASRPPQVQAASLVAKVLPGPASVSLTSARRTGIVARFSAPAGARSAIIRVLRRRAGRLAPVGRVSAPVRAGPNRIRLSSPALRARLTAGTYLVEVRLRGRDGRTGVPAVATLRIRR